MGVMNSTANEANKLMKTLNFGIDYAEQRIMQRDKDSHLEYRQHQQRLST
jgi:hypothetical protein